jgi:Plasmid recombination enzyme
VVKKPSRKKMSGVGFLRFKTLSGAGIVLAASKHNRREIAAELGVDSHIDSSRVQLNYSLHGPTTSRAVADHAKALIAAAGITKLRKNCAYAIEIVFSLPFGFSGDRRGFFDACMDWSVLQFGGVENLLSFDVHMDEAKPHAHALILPLLCGRMRASDMLGNRSTIASRQDSFHKDVAARFGLTRAPAALKGATKAALAKLVLQHMQRAGDAAITSPAWQNIKEAIESDPIPFALTFGIEIAQTPKQGKSFVQIMTAATKPETQKTKTSNPYRGFEKQAQKHKPLCSVRGSAETVPIPAPIDDEYSRTNEDQTPVQNYDSDRGEFHQQAKEPDRKDSGFWVIGGVTIVSKRSMPTIEAVKRIFPNQTVTTLDDSENSNFLSDQSESAHRPNAKRLTRWGFKPL